MSRRYVALVLIAGLALVAAAIAIAAACEGARSADGTIVNAKSTHEHHQHGTLVGHLPATKSDNVRLVSKLESHIRSANDAELLRINPIAFATDKNLKEEEAVDLFLHAAALGLFEMTWILICPIL